MKPSASWLRLLACLGLWALPAAAFERVAPPAPALTPCPEQGAGFVRVPGTATCLRLSGRVVAGADLGAGPGYAGAGYSGSGNHDPVGGRLAIDTRTSTDYGDARSFVRIDSGRRLPH